ncbi:hypothetical protein N7520_011415 [Penicillium odoratum]|uniref:uncharacterized protein n=1 Tax=Penicillium odoratum TaxID=1167516 RepID=UPI00254871C2|nr:uncharacterized protein N7520_011415 [Penicillium odoratum]KAJ5746233.1 hypothetical protein N7520_011415 [Penicillium odoratum]
MASYHRVLETFGRSIQDNSLECDCDIHPWEISINGSQWAGKIRLIGFIDVFFLISYSANARFEHGIIDKLAVEEITGHIPDAKKATEKSISDQDDKKEIKEDDDHEGQPTASGRKHSPPTDLDDSEEDPNAKPEEESETKAKPTETKASTPEASEGKPTAEEATPEFRKTSLLSITSWGHPIGLRASYPKSWIQRYKVEIMKPCSWALSKRIMRGLKPHSTYDLMNDVIRCGIITQGQLVGHIMGVVLAGTQMDDTVKRYIQGLTSGGDAGRQALSNEKI